MHRNPAQKNPSVFISYAHEGDLGERIFKLAIWLRKNNVEVYTDHEYQNRPPKQGWRPWMQHHIENDDVILIVCTERYRRLFEKRETDGKSGLGVTWESAIITSDLYRSRLQNTRFYPIIPDGGDQSHVPSVLQDWNNNHHFPSDNERILALIREDIESSTCLPQINQLANGHQQGTLLSRDNPFGDRGCIRDPERFFNREQELAEIFDELRKGVSLSLVGEAQVGKSSLLAMIAALGPQEMQRDPAEFIIIDMQLIRNEDEFFEALCEELGLAHTLRYRNLAKALRGRQVVVCLDEIEKMKNPQCFSGDERTELRGHANGSDTPLTLVIASRSPLDVLFEDNPFTTSPLASLCKYKPIGGFSPGTSEAFLLHRLQGNSVGFSAGQRQILYEQSDGHPGKLQAEASALYSQLVQH